MGNKVHHGELTCLQDLLDEIEKSGYADRPHAHVRVWFRGQSNHEWDLRPGVYRSGFPGKDESERLRQECHLTQDFRVWSAGLLTGRETEAEIYFLQQHYRMPTRLLDWTHNPLAALYFAVADEETDGKLFMMDAYQLAPTQKVRGFKGIATSRNPVFVEALLPIFRWKKPDDFPKFIIPVRPDHFDHRVTLQRSCFTFHVPARHVLTSADNSSLRLFAIPRNRKKDLRKELTLLGMDHFAVFGDLENLSKMLKAAYRVP